MPTDDEHNPVTTEEDGFGDLSSVIKEGRRARRKQKGTGRKPGPATLLFGRPAFVDEDEEVVVSAKDRSTSSAELMGLVDEARKIKEEQEQQYVDSAADDRESAAEPQNAPEPQKAAAPAGSELDFFAEAEQRFQRQKEDQQRAHERGWDDDDDEYDDDYDDADEPQEDVPQEKPRFQRSKKRQPADGGAFFGNYLLPPPIAGRDPTAPEVTKGKVTTTETPPLSEYFKQSEEDGTPLIRLDKQSMAAKKHASIADPDPEPIKPVPAPVAAEPVKQDKPKVTKHPALLDDSDEVLDRPLRKSTVQISPEEKDKPAVKPAQSVVQSPVQPVEQPPARPVEYQPDQPIGQQPLAQQPGQQHVQPLGGSPVQGVLPATASASAAVPSPPIAYVEPFKRHRQPYRDELVGAGAPERAFTDSFGRKLEASYGQADALLPAKLKIVSVDNKFTHVLFGQDDETLSAYRRDEKGVATHIARMELDTGTIIVQDKTKGSVRNHTPNGFTADYSQSPSGLVQTNLPPEKAGQTRRLMGVIRAWSLRGMLLSAQEAYADGLRRVIDYDPKPTADGAEEALVRSIVTTFASGDKQKEEFLFDNVRGRMLRVSIEHDDAESGKHTVAKFGRDGRLSGLKITERTGHYTDIHLSAQTGIYQGRRCDQNHKTVEEAFLNAGDVVFSSVADPTIMRGERVLLYEGDEDVWLSRLDSDKTNPDLGSVFLVGANKSLVQTYSGRLDQYAADGSVTFENGPGEKSLQTVGGEVLVTHWDGAAVKMHRNFVFEIKEAHVGGQFVKEEALPSEIEYLKKRTGTVDLRDFAEMHRRHRHKPERIDALIRQLDQLDYLKQANIPQERIDGIRFLLLHHIACPTDIFVGTANTSAAAAVEHDFAVENPARYVSIVRESLMGQLTIVGGNKVQMNAENLLANDMSGRNLASRIFQTAATKALYHPIFDFENTISGQGRDSKRRALPVVTIEKVAEVIHKLGGGEMSVVEVDSADELQAAWHAGFERGLIVWLDSGAMPLSVGDGRSQSHFANLLGLLEGKPPRALLALHLGLSFDRCLRKTALDGQKLVDNMRGIADWSGLLLVHGGLHTRRYRVNKVGEKCTLRSVTLSGSPLNNAR